MSQTHPVTNQGIDLRSFLADQQNEGQLDSQGQFTISAEKAREKLAAFSLPGEYDWVLKIVQAVNLWKAPRLVVAQTRVATSFTFAPATCPEHTEILSALTQVSLEHTNPTHALSMALRSLVEQVGLSFVLAFGPQSAARPPIYAGDDTSQLNPKTLALWIRIPGQGLRLTVSHFRGDESLTGRYIPTFTQVPPRHLSILQALQWNCVTSSVPIFLEGRRLNDPTQLSEVGFSPGFRVLRAAVLSGGDSRDARRTLLEDYPWGTLSSRIATRGTFSGNEPWYLLRTLDWSHLNEVIDVETFERKVDPKLRPPDHRILVFRQGVVCSTYSIINSSWGTNLTLAVPADHQRSDLSGLRVELGKSQRKAIDNIWRRVGKELGSYGAQIATLRESPPQDTDFAASAEELDDIGIGNSVFTDSLGTTLRRWFGKVSSKHPLDSQAQLTEPLSLAWQRFVLEDLRRVTSDLHSPQLSHLPS